MIKMDRRSTKGIVNGVNRVVDEGGSELFVEPFPDILGYRILRVTHYEIAQIRVLHTFEPVFGQFRDETEDLHPLPLIIDAVVDGTDERLGRRTHDAVVDELPFLRPGLGG